MEDKHLRTLAFLWGCKFQVGTDSLWHEQCHLDKMNQRDMDNLQSIDANNKILISNKI